MEDLLESNCGAVHVAVSLLAVVVAGTALLLLSPRSVHGQERPLDAIAHLAIERNLAVRSVSESERQSILAVRQATGALLPAVGLEARYSELSGAVDLGEAINPAYAALNQLLGRTQFPTDVHQTLPYKQETKLRAVMPLFNTAIFAQMGVARAVRELRGAERKAAVRRLDAAARIAYLNYAAAARAVGIHDAALSVLTENARVADRLFRAGTLTADAVYRARAAKADGDQQRAEAVRERDAALGALNLLLDRPADTPVPALDESALPELRPLTLDEAMTASQYREERQQVRATAAATTAQSHLASGTFLPAVTLVGDYGVQGDKYRFDRNHDASTVSLLLSWNLFNGLQDAARIQAAQSQLRVTALRGAELDRSIALEVRTAFDAERVAVQALDAARLRQEAAQRAFALVDKRFLEGLASHLEWSDAHAQLTASELNLVITRFTHAVRVVDLERAAALRGLP